MIVYLAAAENRFPWLSYERQGSAKGRPEGGDAKAGSSVDDDRLKEEDNERIFIKY